MILLIVMLILFIVTTVVMFKFKVLETLDVENNALPILNFHIRRFNVTLDKRDISIYIGSRVKAL